MKIEKKAGYVPGCVPSEDIKRLEERCKYAKNPELIARCRRARLYGMYDENMCFVSIPLISECELDVEGYVNAIIASVEGGKGANGLNILVKYNDQLVRAI